MTLVEQAKIYVNQMHWSVIPIAYREKKAVCAWKIYQHRLPNDAELERWFRKISNLAIVTGEVSDHLLVLDFDDMGAYLNWFERTGIHSLFAYTGRGKHVYFRLLGDPIKNGKFWVAGKPAGEIRYNGGYVLAPPSIHPNRKEYIWGTFPIISIRFSELEISLLSHVWHSSSSSSLDDSPLPPSIKNPGAYCLAALERELEKINRAEEGTRNENLFTASLKLKKYAKVLGERLIVDKLFETGCRVGLNPREVERTINSAFSY